MENNKAPIIRQADIKENQEKVYNNVAEAVKAFDQYAANEKFTYDKDITKNRFETEIDIFGYLDMESFSDTKTFFLIKNKKNSSRGIKIY